MSHNLPRRNDAQAPQTAALDMFTRTSSAPGAVDANTSSEKEQIDDIFRIVKRNSIANRVDHQASANESEFPCFDR
jgi:hypothetical protein